MSQRSREEIDRDIQLAIRDKLTELCELMTPQDVGQDTPDLAAIGAWLKDARKKLQAEHAPPATDPGEGFRLLRKGDNPEDVKKGDDYQGCDGE